MFCAVECPVASNNWTIYNNACYANSGPFRSWIESQAFCESYEGYDGNLVSILTEEENNFIIGKKELNNSKIHLLFISTFLQKNKVHFA